MASMPQRAPPQLICITYTNSTTMADNFLEKQYAEYEARKAAQAQAKRKAWQKKMKEYQARLAAEKSEKK